MKTTNPEKWVVLKLGDNYKVLATWYGGYFDGDSWKLNSGITEVSEDDDYFYFHGYSGSIYKCHKEDYGMGGYTYSILNNMRSTAEEQDMTIALME